MKIGFLGAGKMAHALAKGFISAGLSRAEEVTASCPLSDTVFLDPFRELGCQTTHVNPEAVDGASVVVVAVKPPVVPRVLAEVNPAVRMTSGSSSPLFLSIAMGIPTRMLEQMLPPKTRVVRVMPNTPVLVRSGASVYARGTSADADDADLTRRLLSSVGTCEEVPETLMDACTGLSGSGPAYMYLAMEALADGGVKMGIPRDMAYRLSAQTLIGAARMLLVTGRHPGQLKDDVCSPGGCTIQALYFLEKCGLRASLMEAVEAATVKSKLTGRKE